MRASGVRSKLAATLAAGAVTFGLVVPTAIAFTPTSATERVSVATGGGEAHGQSGDSGDSSDINTDGRFVAFESDAPDLVTGDGNGAKDVFRRDRLLGTTTLISDVGAAVPGNAPSFHPSISGDGRYVAFSSLASDFVLGDTNALPDVFVRDVTSGTTVLVSTAPDGTPGGGDSTSMSSDGRYVAFTSDAPLVVDDTNGRSDLYVHDRDADGNGIFDEATGTSTVRVSVATDGTQGNDFSYGRISPNGRFVAFVSLATNLVANDQPLCTFDGVIFQNCSDVFLRDRDADGNGIFDEQGGVTTTLVTRTSGTNGAQADGFSGDPGVDDNGDVVFSSSAANLGATPGSAAAFVRENSPTEPLTLVGQGNSNGSSISDDGRFISFDTASPLVLGDTNNTGDAYVYDRLTNMYRRASVTADGAEVGLGGVDPVISGDGLQVLFASPANNLVAGDTNGVFDLFARDLGAPVGGVPTEPGPPGFPVIVIPVDPGTLTSPVMLSFPTVTTGGTTTLTTSTTGPTPPGGFSVGDPPTYFDISTTATFSGDVEVCISYAGLAFTNESLIRLYHFVLPSAVWQDVTTSLDPVNDVVCGLTSSFSPFAVLQGQYGFTGFAKPIAAFPSFTTVKAGVSLPLRFGLGGDRGLAIFANGFPKSASVACISTTPVAGTEPTVGGDPKPLTYDKKTATYTYTWKTSKAWANTCRQVVMTFTDRTTARANFKFTK